MTSLTYLACGQTRHKLSAIFTSAPPQTRIFPAGVFLYKSGPHKVLFDTGYAPNTAAAGIAGWLYSKLLPPEVAPQDVIPEQLNALGIAPDQITHVVLSHAHPDHIGGLRYFPNATIVLTAGTASLLESSRIKDGVLKGLVPQWFAQADLLTLEPSDFSTTTLIGERTFQTLDLLGNGSYQLLELPGHAQGHLGALIDGAILLAGDAVWSRDLLGLSDQMRPLPAYIQNNFEQYKRTTQMLLDMENAGVRVCPSHDAYPDTKILG